ncbi:MAG TPA: HIT domain-containing protein, partial [Clostridia bacterium]|nr:HIT domain-containing protein [Clostridia bacterium]
MSDCIFCKIIDGAIPAPKLYEDENMIIIKDISPQAPVHLLLIVKEHYKNLSALDERRAETLGKCLLTLSCIAEKLGLKGGYRIVSNCGADARQS